MGVEIERKFLVTEQTAHRLLAGTRSQHIVQGYLAQGGMGVRVRLVDDCQAWLTLKGPRTGIRQAEYEYEIPPDDARAMLEHASLGALRKRRHFVPHEGFTFEVDVYEGPLQGLVTAELELTHEAQEVPWPAWLGTDVSLEPRYSNAALARLGLPQTD